MATKNNPGQFDCYQNAEPDEPMFVLLARDKHAPAMIWLWAVLRELEHEDPAKVKEARECAVAMIEWSAARQRKAVGLGQSVLAGVLELIRAANAQAPKALNSPSDVEAVRAFFALTTIEKSEAASQP